MAIIDHTDGRVEQDPSGADTPVPPSLLWMLVLDAMDNKN